MAQSISSLTRLVHVVNGGLVAATVGGSLWAVSSLPAEIPRHFGLFGTADAYWEATLAHWMLLPLFGVGLAGLLYAVAAVVDWSVSVEEGATAPDDRAAVDEIRRYVAAVRLYLYATAAGMLLLFGLLQWGVYVVATTAATGLPPWLLIADAAIIVAVLGGAGGLAWWTVTRGDVRTP